VPLRSPGVGKLDGAGPFCTGVPMYPNPDGGGFLAVAAPSGGSKAGPALKPPVPPPAPHVEAQAVLHTILGATKSVVAARSKTAHYLRSNFMAWDSIPLFAEIIGQFSHVYTAFFHT
jgi:hypothetical protein